LPFKDGNTSKENRVPFAFSICSVTFTARNYYWVSKIH
jgi:hypothetical protein